MSSLRIKVKARMDVAITGGSPNHDWLEGGGVGVNIQDTNICKKKLCKIQALTTALQQKIISECLYP